MTDEGIMMQFGRGWGRVPYMLACEELKGLHEIRLVIFLFSFFGFTILVFIVMFLTLESECLREAVSKKIPVILFFPFFFVGNIRDVRNTRIL